MQPDWAFGFSGGTLERIRGLIQSNYADSSRPSLKTADRHWARFCAKHGISVFRPQVVDNFEAKVMEEMILVLFLGYLLFGVRVQGSTCESYFSLMKGWHGEEMGYQPASSSLFTTVCILKMLRGARRNFPSVFAEREAHSDLFPEVPETVRALIFHQGILCSAWRAVDRRCGDTANFLGVDRTVRLPRRSRTRIDGCLSHENK